MRHLIADIGGTNARFQLVENGHVGDRLVLSVAKFSDSYSLIENALSQLSCVHPHQVHIAVAGRPENDRVSLTNGLLVFDAAMLSKALGRVACVKLYNDVEAAALGLRYLGKDDTCPLGTKLGDTDVTQPLGLLSVGTGLGISCYLPDENGGVALSTEGGHASLPATTTDEHNIITALERQIGRVSSEHVLSGTGLVTLYEIMTGNDAPSPGWVVSNALDGNRASRNVLNQFCAFLGSVAGDIALIYGAWGGVFIGGGVPPRFADFLAMSSFRERFESKGTFGPALQNTPTQLVLREDLALMGLAEMATAADDLTEN